MITRENIRHRGSLSSGIKAAAACPGAIEYAGSSLIVLLHWSFVALSISLASGAVAQSAYYDKFIYIRSLPFSPISPNNLSDCHRYDASLDKFIAELAAAHEQCLKAERKPSGGVDIGNMIDDATHKCSNPACQELHSAMYKMPSEAAKKKSECQARLRANPEWQKECKRLSAFDKPLEEDVIGNSLAGAGASAARGAVTSGAKRVGKKVVDETAKEKLGLKAEKRSHDGCE